MLRGEVSYQKDLTCKQLRQLGLEIVDERRPQLMLRREDIPCSSLSHLKTNVIILPIDV